MISTQQSPYPILIQTRTHQRSTTLLLNLYMPAPHIPTRNRYFNRNCATS